VVGVDEAGRRVAGDHWWRWIFQNAEGSYSPEAGLKLKPRAERSQVLQTGSTPARRGLALLSAGASLQTDSLRYRAASTPRAEDEETSCPWAIENRAGPQAGPVDVGVTFPFAMRIKLSPGGLRSHFPS